MAESNYYGILSSPFLTNLVFPVKFEMIKKILFIPFMFIAVGCSISPNENLAGGKDTVEVYDSVVWPQPTNPLYAEDDEYSPYLDTIDGEVWLCWEYRGRIWSVKQ